MTAIHHVSDDLLLRYEAGTLSEGWSLAVATHLALCPECRARARLAAAVGGALVEASEIADVSPGAFDSVMARIADVPPAAPTPCPRATVGVLPEPLRSYVGGDADRIRWRTIGGGVRQMLIRTADRSTTARLLLVPAGRPVPEHGHGGRELTVVLAGSLVDGGAVFRRGDIEIADETVEHQPAAGPGEDCICLAVTDAPLRFKSLVARLAQPFLKI